MATIQFYSEKMKSLKAMMFLCFLIPMGMFGQSWPITSESPKQKITVFKPAIEAYQSDEIAFRAAIAVTEESEQTPVFGSIWGTAKLRNGSSQGKANLWGTVVDDIRFPDGITTEQLNDLAGQIEDAINARQPEMSMDEIRTAQQNAEREKELAAGISHTPPKVYYASETTLLVNIDGDPVLMATETAGVEMVANTPFLLLKYQNMFYLGNGALWYKSAKATDGFMPEKNIPNAVTIAANSLKTSDEEAAAEATGDFYPKVLVSTVPAELIQTEGSPAFSPIQGTNLLYVSNTEDQLLLDISRQAYFVLLSGRWYTATKLDAAWSYIPADQLPADFANIPEGTEKDVVLASIAGTKASKEAVRDAMVPKAAAVDRNTATSDVMYDGSPEFEPIQGTDLQMAVNSSNTVIVERNKYYLVDNGVWFTAVSPNGPWYVSDYRPVQVVYIPASSPAYNVKYVEIYHSTPSVVYVGYTSGYLSSYVTNDVIVYGTGYRYRPWRGRYYYPRPCTWGFGMTYNPWYGWSIDISYGVGGYGWFGYGYPRHYHRHGWWGPAVYRPPYCVPYSHYYGYCTAEPRPIHYGREVTRRPVNTTRRATNIYANSRRTGVASTRQQVTSRTTATSSRESRNYSSSARPERYSVNSNTRQSGNRGSSTRQGTATTRPSTRPESSGTTVREGANTNTRPSTRPNTGQSGTTTRPSITQQGTTTRPSTSMGSGSRQSTGTTTRPSTKPESSRTVNRLQQTTTRPSDSQSGTTTRPQSNQQRRGDQQSVQPSPTRQNSGSSGRQSQSGTTARPQTNQQGRSSQQSVQPSPTRQSSNSSGRQSTSQSSTSTNSNSSRSSGSRR